MFPWGKYDTCPMWDKAIKKCTLVNRESYLPYANAHVR